jgi:hypothetical protein
VTVYDSGGGSEQWQCGNDSGGVTVAVTVAEWQSGSEHWQWQWQW